LIAGMDMNVLDCDLLLSLASVSLQGFDLNRERSHQFHGKVPVGVLRGIVCDPFNSRSARTAAA